ncbi:hypothetical protein BDF21DRAFT_402774 [Thamnidium elegans]|uniref:Uncharacterized protein n=1 Tax=Thamnidium elegans TaxID=101142 RepID=A0A8H7SGI1_9FUNG|nr:hypothetical protein INT48_007812 [Thamnidium elegans]KAI8063038.1 hypothetical protein BDF21DRAFT_402774 [Thamnidium elegans]
MLKVLLVISLMALMQAWASPIEGQNTHKQAMRVWWNSFYQQESQAPNPLAARDVSPAIIPPWRPSPPWGPPPPWRPPPPVWTPPWRPPPPPWRPPPWGHRDN